MITGQPSTTLCPVCQATDSVPLIEMKQAPVHCNLLWPTRERALAAPRGDIQLVYCPQCSHIFNKSFDPALMAYTQDYENSLHFSPRFQQYATALAERLVERYDLYGKDIVGVGSGKGDFLIMLCELGNNRGVGFDPSYAPGEGEETAPITFIQNFYTEKYIHYKADFISCRHVLEHIQAPTQFVNTVRKAVGDRPDTVVFFEVPNVLFTLRESGIWDIIYEHCSYFSPASLAHTFRQNGFRVLNVQPAFGGQFLTIEAALGNGAPDSWDDEADKRQMAQDVTLFAHNYRQKVTAWQQRLKQMAADKKRVVVWGAGSKGVTFLNILQTREQIKYVVDINPRKKGMYIAGTGQQIIDPDFLPSYQPDAVIIMNANYKREIRQTVQDLGITADILLA